MLVGDGRGVVAALDQATSIGFVKVVPGGGIPDAFTTSCIRHPEEAISPAP